jgi:hypothetical protein
MKEVASMRRFMVLVTVVVLMAATSVLGAGYAFASANPENRGNRSDAPGQKNALDNCTENFNKQGEKGVVTGGGPKAEPIEEDGALVPLEPTNCDHFFQDLGRIGKDKQ